MGLLQIALLSFWLLVAGAGIAALLGSARRACGYAAFLCTFAAWVGFTYVALFRTGTLEAGPLLAVPGLGAALTLRIDNLSAVFLVLISFLGMLTALYSIRYMDSYPEEDLRRYYPFCLLFIAGMVGVVCVSDMLFFFVFWEFMTLASYLLVVFEKESAMNLRAGLKYFVMTHAATACMFVAAILLYLYGEHSFDFSALQRTMVGLADSDAPVLHLILLLFLLGFATKAGIFPLGDWLPDAHPAAPSGASAMLSGVMIKLGVYGLLRVFIWMLPICHASLIWGGIIATLGTLSLFVGSLTAFIQNDAKRLLAFSSMGQIGYVFLAAGTAIAFLPVHPAVAAIALIAALYHTVNDGCFKALLFLNAGSLLYRAGSRNLDCLGGMAKVLPITAVTALIGCLAVAGVPPLNGFASKWAIFQATIIGGIEIPIYAAFGVLGLFASMVTLAYVVKFFATAFLGAMSDGVVLRPDAGSEQERRDVSTSMQVPQVLLAVVCIALGLAPGFMMQAIYRRATFLAPCSLLAFIYCAHRCFLRSAGLPSGSAGQLR